MPLDLNILVDGEAGQGIQTIGFVLGKTFSRGGLHVFADQDYESRIRGGHNFFRVRVKSGELKAQTEMLDILVALNKAAIDIHRNELKDDGLIIADMGSVKMETSELPILNVPLEKLATDTAGDKIMANSVAIGVVLGSTRFSV